VIRFLLRRLRNRREGMEQQRYTHLEIRQSSIHGKGLFAAEPIEEGKLIGTYEGRSTSDDGIYVLWVEEDDGSYSGIEGWNELRFLNHSAAPNAEFADQELYALCSIEPGEEICFHYGDEWEDVE